MNTHTTSTLNESNDNSREARFVNYLLSECLQNKGFAANMRRADNPNTETYSWDILIKFGVNIEKDYERLPYGLIAAAIANSKQDSNGSLLFAQAIGQVYPDGNQNDQAKMRLRRVLACTSTAELCHILRPLLSLVQSRLSSQSPHPEKLDFITLLKDLLYFTNSNTRIKERWAIQFYRTDDATQQKSNDKNPDPTAD